MTDLFLTWLNNSVLTVSDDIKFIFCCIASYFILSFILDFFRYLLYYVGGRRT